MSEGEQAINQTLITRREYVAFGLGTLTGAVIPVGTWAISLWVQHRNRKEDKDEQKALSKVRLLPVASRYEPGFSVLTIRNLSTTTPAAVTSIEFRIDDPAALKRIERKQPKPRQIIAGAGNTHDDVAFKEGAWLADGTYLFSKDTGIHLRKCGDSEGKDIDDLFLTIQNPLWSNEEFTGTIEIFYSGDLPDSVTESLVVPKVTIKAQNVNVQPPRRQRR
jgi:hypothetical protein